MARRRANEGLEEDERIGLGAALTPMIDVIFQLLIFFLVNIKFRTLEGLLKAFLPRANAIPEPDRKKDQVFITITEPTAGTLVLAVNGRPVGGMTERQKYAALEERLRGIKESFDKMPPVIVDADRRLPYKYVIYALNVCGKLDIEDVMFQFPQR